MLVQRVLYHFKLQKVTILRKDAMLPAFLVCVCRSGNGRLMLRVAFHLVLAMVPIGCHPTFACKSMRSCNEAIVRALRVCVCRSGNGRLTLRELRRGDLLEALEALDREDDINKVWFVLCLYTDLVI